MSTTIRTIISGATPVDVASLTISDLLGRIADSGDGVTTNSDVDISAIRGLSLVERALLSAIRGLNVVTVPPTTNPFSYVRNTTADTSAESTVVIPNSHAVNDGWVNVSDIFVDATTETPTNTYPYLADVGDLTTSRALEIDDFRITLTHNQDNADYDFELRLVIGDDQASQVIITLDGVVSPVRTGPVYSMNDGRIATTVNMRGYVEAGFTGLTAATNYLTVQARLAPNTFVATTPTPNIRVQTDTTNLAYRIIQ